MGAMKWLCIHLYVLLALVNAACSSADTGVLVKRYNNCAFAGDPAINNSSNLSATIAASDLQSLELSSVFVVPSTSQYNFSCYVDEGSVLMWLDDHLLCGTIELFAPENAPLPPFVSLHKGDEHFVRVRFAHNETTKNTATLQVLVSIDGGNPEPIEPSALLLPVSSSPRTMRDHMQTQLATGWATWWRPSALATTLLPEGSAITLGLCQLSTKECMNPSALFTPEQDRGEEEPTSKAISRPGLHTYDRSYWQLYLSYNGFNVSLEWTGTNAGQGSTSKQDLCILATMVNGSRSDAVLVASGNFVFYQPGTVSASGHEIRFTSPGLRTVTFHTATPTYSDNGTIPVNSTAFVALDLSETGKAGLCTYPTTLDNLEKVIGVARSNAAVRLNTSVPNHDILSEASTAMMSVLMWNTIAHPTQLGPFVTVSRSFTAYPYELFEWDTYFGAAMLSSDIRSLPVGLSSLIQITKSKTLGPKLDLHGFVPGYSKGGRWLSEDRTERPVGATILLQIFRRWERSDHDLTWVLELLYNDLLDWHNWLWEYRRIQPLLLAGMGSDSCRIPSDRNQTSGGQLWCKPSWGMGQLQGARFESLDNSPMYDAPENYSLWDPVSQRMQLYDVGQSAAIVMECNALAEIATVLGDRTNAALLQARAKALGGLISTHMWSDSLGVFTNVLINGTQYPRISPTSFYPMLAKVASDTQASTMVRQWLTNSSRFCVPRSASEWAKTRDTSVKADGKKTCFWGVPSISADDPAYMVPGGTSGIYWRGETWSPQAYLVYLSLQNYKHIPEINDARKGLVSQQLSLMMSVWTPRHHICENFPSYLLPKNVTTDGNSCTGNQFYIWGALPALMALTDAQL